MSDPVLMAKNIYIYIYDKYVKAYIFGPSRRYSRITTVCSWQTETGEPYCNIEFLSNMVSISKLSPIKTLFTHSWEWGMGYLLWVIDALYVYVVGVVYAALCCNHEPCYNETTRCRNIKYSSVTRYPYLFDTSAFRGPRNDHSINILPWHSFNWRDGNPLQTSIFKHFHSNFPVKIQKTGDTYPMAYGWFMFGI